MSEVENTQQAFDSAPTTPRRGGSLEELVGGLRAVGEITRLRLLSILSHGELNVSELTQVLGQSQPRISRHLKLMSDAGLVDRHKEGSWVLFRIREQGAAAEIARAILALLPGDDPVLTGDRKRLGRVLETRRRLAMAYFGANAARWDYIRSLHVAEEEVEAAMARLIGPQAGGFYLDLGTGTGRMLELFAPLAGQAIGIDQSREMLAVARAKLDAEGLNRVQVRQGDMLALPYGDGVADLITIHQVLHYLDDPARALAEAARVLKAGGRLLIVDFAPHALEALREEHAHRRLGIAAEAMAAWLQRVGLKLIAHRSLEPPDQRQGQGLTVSLWLARRPASPDGRSAAGASRAIARDLVGS
jgi:ubiquinone/menaquinone biosynthesis C-methylase UbiE/DNA-binding transcriptional ArsR family regulator